MQVFLEDSITTSLGQLTAAPDCSRSGLAYNYEHIRALAWVWRTVAHVEGEGKGKGKGDGEGKGKGQGTGKHEGKAEGEGAKAKAKAKARAGARAKAGVHLRSLISIPCFQNKKKSGANAQLRSAAALVADTACEINNGTRRVLEEV